MYVGVKGGLVQAEESVYYTVFKFGEGDQVKPSCVSRVKPSFKTVHFDQGVNSLILYVRVRGGPTQAE